MERVFPETRYDKSGGLTKEGGILNKRRRNQAPKRYKSKNRPEI